MTPYTDMNEYHRKRDAYAAAREDSMYLLKEKAKTQLSSEYRLLSISNDPFTKGLTEQQYIDKHVDECISELQEC
jgi:hypothetical protein